MVMIISQDSTSSQHVHCQDTALPADSKSLPQPKQPASPPQPSACANSPPPHPHPASPSPTVSSLTHYPHSLPRLPLPPHRPLRDRHNRMLRPNMRRGLQPLRCQQVLQRPTLDTHAGLAVARMHQPAAAARAEVAAHRRARERGAGPFAEEGRWLRRRRRARLL